MGSEKIVAFEVDFETLKNGFTHSELAQGNKLFCELGTHNHLFIFTNNSLQVALQFLREYGYPVGYLLANSGAIAYNLSSGLKIYENFLEPGITQVILRVGFINNLTSKIHSIDSQGNLKTFVFGPNYLNYRLKLIFKQYIQLTSWQEVIKILNTHSIYSIEVLFRENKEGKLNAFLSNFSEFQEFFEHFISSPTIYFFSPLNSKFRAIKEIMQLSEEQVKNNLIYSSLSLPDLKLAIKAYFGLSLDEFSKFIEHQFDSNQVIYLGREQYLWLNGGREHNYLGRENLIKIDGLSRKIKKLDFSKIKGKEKELKNNAFELNLQTSTLFSKILNEKERWGEPMQKKMSSGEKDGVVDLYLGLEQLNHLVSEEKLCPPVFS